MNDEPPSSSSSSGLRRAALSTDPSSIDGIINALYGALSFTSGGEPSLDRLRELFAEGARLIKVSEGASESLDLQTFSARIRAAQREGRMTSFRERELARRTDVFGAIAQVFGTFERTTDGGESVSRGINAIQLRRDTERWWIESLMWADERDGCPLPSEYLPRDDRPDEVKRRRRARTLRTQPHRTTPPG